MGNNTKAEIAGMGIIAVLVVVAVYALAGLIYMGVWNWGVVAAFGGSEVFGMLIAEASYLQCVVVSVVAGIVKNIFTK